MAMGLPIGKYIIAHTQYYSINEYLVHKENHQEVAMN